MRRFAMNRWCASVLVFVVAVGSLPSFVTPASALTIRQVQGTHNGLNGEYGDPDIPGTGGMPMPGRMQPATPNPDHGWAAGDSQYLSGMEKTAHLRIVLELLRVWLFR
jgi:hypothetical protein